VAPYLRPRQIALVARALEPVERQRTAVLGGFELCGVRFDLDRRAA
jgi:hypothetical protein